MLEKDFVSENVVRIYEECPGNVIAEKNSLFEEYKKVEVIGGPWHRSPSEWLNGAKTAISI